MLFQLFLKKQFLSKPLEFLFLAKMTIVSLLCISFVAWSPAVFAEKYPPTVTEKTPPKILVYGDSLSAAYGLPQQQGWVALLQNKLNQQGYMYQVVNASISGETTSGGLTRFSKTLRLNQPDIVILELGANDGLRGLPIKNMAENLKKMIEESKKVGAQVVLLGMMIPPNYGPKYTHSFSNTYTQLSQEYKTNLVPFMLNNIAGKRELIQDDGLHPNAQGQPIILDNVWPHLKSLLKKSY